MQICTRISSNKWKVFEFLKNAAFVINRGLEMCTKDTDVPAK